MTTEEIHQLALVMANALQYRGATAEQIDRAAIAVSLKERDQLVHDMRASYTFSSPDYLDEPIRKIKVAGIHILVLE